MKRLISIPILIALFVLPIRTEPWGGTGITITDGTAIRVVKVRTIVSSLFFQMKTGGTGRGYILSAPKDVTCAVGGAGTTLIAELIPATATSPGGNAVIPSNSDPQGGIDAALYCVDGSNSGDIVTIAWNLRN